MISHPEAKYKECKCSKHSDKVKKKKRGEALILSFKEPLETNDRRALSLGYVHVRSVLTVVRKLRDTSKIQCRHSGKLVR